MITELILEKTTKDELYNYMLDKIQNLQGKKVFYMEDKYTPNAKILFEDWTWYCSNLDPRQQGQFLLVQANEYEVLTMRTKDYDVTLEEIVDEWWKYIKENY